MACHRFLIRRFFFAAGQLLSRRFGQGLIQLFHQSRFSPGGVIGVDDPFLGRFI